MTAKSPTHPGDSLQEFASEMGWSACEFADRLGVNRDTVAKILDGQCGISPQIALALERIGWSDAEFWMRRQAKYDLALARREMETTTGFGN